MMRFAHYELIRYCVDGRIIGLTSKKRTGEVIEDFSMSGQGGRGHSAAPI